MKRLAVRADRLAIARLRCEVLTTKQVIKAARITRLIVFLLMVHSPRLVP